ncbi:MAG: RNA 2',3'-cyclic phosphodiesterase [Bacteroidales bacterium]
MKRLFIAIKIHPSEKLRALVSALKRDLIDDKIKWVELHNLHMTLKFLGDTPEAHIPEIVRQVRRSCRDIPPFTLTLKDTGIFGSRYKPRVIWCGTMPDPAMKKLIRNLYANLETIGIEPGRQNVVPHLTLGRIKYIANKKHFQDVLDANRPGVIQESRVDEFYLLASTLRSQGPVHEIMETFRLD